MITSIKNPNGKSAQISLRIPSEMRSVLAQAAALQNMSISRFIYGCGYEAARQVVDKHNLKHPHQERP